jgi:uncharacterized protein
MLILSLLGISALMALIFGPQLLIQWTMNRHAADRPDFPGTGAELARELLDKAGLQNVKIEITDKELGDHYSPEEKTVRLSERNFNGKSVTAVAVAAHECAHALQDRDGYKPLHIRQKLAKSTILIERTGSMLLMATPIVFAITRSPVVLFAEIVAAIGILASTIVIHVFTLPTEFNASFKRALPALTHYLPADDMKAASSVLKAAAFTYVAGALISLINIGRWIRLLRF